MRAPRTILAAALTLATTATGQILAPTQRTQHIATANAASEAPPAGSIIAPKLSASAPMTRPNPFMLMDGTATLRGFNGPVRSVTERRMDVTVASGQLKETLDLIDVTTFDPQGRLVEQITTDATGQETYRRTNEYAQGRLTRSTFFDSTRDEPRSADVYAYDALGNLSSQTHLDANGNVTAVSRYTLFPNGYISTTYPTSGPPSSQTLVLYGPSKTPHLTEYVYHGKLSVLATNTFVNGRVTQKIMDMHLEGIVLQDTFDARGRTLTWLMTGIGPPLSRRYVYEHPDRYDNPTRISKYDVTTRSGAEQRRLSTVTYLTYQYGN